LTSPRYAGATMVSGPTQTPETAARAAMTRHEWEDARDLFLQAEKDTALSAPDLEMLGEAEFWSGHPQERVDALERAYAAYLESGARAKAAEVALQLSEFAFARQAMAIANGWMSRAQHQLEGEPISPAHAFLAVFNAFMALYAGDVDGALHAGERALELAKQFGSRDVDALARNLKGRALLRKGEITAGLALIDESTVAAVGGELKAWATANVYCGTIDACRDLADWKRAAEWTDEADREMQRQRIRGYPGVCRVIGQKSSAFAEPGRRRRKKLARPASSWSSLASCLAWAGGNTKSGKFGCGWATSPRPKSHSSVPTSTAGIRSPGCRCCVWHEAT